MLKSEIKPDENYECFCINYFLPFIADISDISDVVRQEVVRTHSDLNISRIPYSTGKFDNACSQQYSSGLETRTLVEKQC
jgi:hypothetical protein